jgi:hypothetical protein
MKSISEKSTRLHYLDWLRLAATLGVFLLHTMLPFDEVNWFVNNAEQSSIVIVARVLLVQFGMPLFFLLAGVGSWFALRRRSGRQFISERFRRLVVPFAVGVILIQPFQTYIAVIHEGRSDWYSGPFLSLDYFRFYLDSRMGPAINELLTPEVFINYGSHLWFVGYLFVFSLILLPLFFWLKKDSGKRIISSLADLCEKRGIILAGILPLALIRIILQPLFPAYGSWADFFFMLVFFVSGYILFADERLTQIVRRDGKLLLATGIISMAVVLVAHFTGAGGTMLATPGTVGFFFAWIVLGSVGWCWVLIMLHFGMKFLDFRNKRLDYGQEAIMPFYIFHHPLIIVIAFFVVQWDAGVLVKWLAIVLSSVVVTLGLTDAIRRIKPVRALFGMKSRRRKEVKAISSPV